MTAINCPCLSWYAYFKVTPLSTNTFISGLSQTKSVKNSVCFITNWDDS